MTSSQAPWGWAVTWIEQGFGQQSEVLIGADHEKFARERAENESGRPGNSDVEVLALYASPAEEATASRKDYPASFYAALNTADIGYAAFSVSGINIFGDYQSIKAAQSWNHEAINVEIYWRPEVIRQRETIAALQRGIDEDQLREKLQKLCDEAGSIRKWAKLNNLHEEQVRLFLGRKRPAEPKLLAALGLRRVITYLPIQTEEPQASETEEKEGSDQGRADSQADGDGGATGILLPFCER